MMWKRFTLKRRHNESDGFSNHQPHDFLHNRLFKAKVKETSKLRVTGLCEGNSPVTGEFQSPFDDVTMTSPQSFPLPPVGPFTND